MARSEQLERGRETGGDCHTGRRRCERVYEWNRTSFAPGGNIEALHFSRTMVAPSALLLIDNERLVGPPDPRQTDPDYPICFPLVANGGVSR